MKVISEGKLGRVMCKHCMSVIEFEAKELHEGRSYDHIMHMDIWTKYFFCPVCNRKVIVQEMGFEDI